MRPRGMRNTPTLQGLAHQNPLDNRGKAVGELARYEHERHRLLRELEIWSAKKEKTECRLHEVEERIKLRQQALYEPNPSEKQAKSKDRPGDERPSKNNWREVSLEY